MPFDIVALRYTVLAADTLSFARAAAHAGVKQATLSKRIASLEQRLGLMLFERSTRGAVPTGPGLDFINDGRRLLADLETLHASGKAIGTGQQGSLTVGFSTSLAAGNMRALIADFVERFPDLHIVGVEADRGRLSQALHARSVDFAAISGDLSIPGLMKRALWSERVMAVLPQMHSIAAKERIYWSDLRRERFVIARQDPGLDLANLVTARLSEPGWQPDVVTREVARDNVINMVSIGRYVSLTTDTALGRSLPDVVVREIHELTGTVTHIDYSGYWRSDNSAPALTHLLKLIGGRYPP